MATPREIVRAGYNAVSFAYGGDHPDADWPKNEQWVNELTPRIANSKTSRTGV